MYIFNISIYLIFVILFKFIKTLFEKDSCSIVIRNPGLFLILNCLLPPFLSISKSAIFAKIISRASSSVILNISTIPNSIEFRPIPLL